MLDIIATQNYIISKFSKAFAYQDLATHKDFLAIRYHYLPKVDSSISDAEAVHLELMPIPAKFVKTGYELFSNWTDDSNEKVIDAFFQNRLKSLCSSIVNSTDVDLKQPNISIELNRARTAIARDTRRGMGNRVFANTKTLDLLRNVLDEKAFGQRFVQDSVFETIYDIPVITSNAVPENELVITYMGDNSSAIDSGIFCSIILKDVLGDESIFELLLAESEMDDSAQKYYRKLKIVN